MANTKFTSIKSDYSIVFDRASEVLYFGEDHNVPETGFSFSGINDINEMEQQRTVDLVGIV